MSAKYGWRPVNPPPPDNYLDIGLFDMLARYAQGITANEDTVNRLDAAGYTLDGSDIPWLAGLRFGLLYTREPDAEILSEIDELIEAIQEHGIIELTAER